MKNHIKAYWNDTPVIDARCTHVMAYQICELMANEFIGATSLSIMDKVYKAGFLTKPMNEPLPETVILGGDLSGNMVIAINMPDDFNPHSRLDAFKATN